MTESDSPPAENKQRGLDVKWLAACAAITAIGFFLRVIWLGLRPLHHDEGVNGWFLTNLFRDGVYKYDPANYHGPTLYYIALAFTEIFGLNTLTIRWSVVVWGVLSIVLVFYLRRFLGSVASLAAGLLIALSPGLVYISRYFIHETFFVFLGLGLVLSVVLFITNERVRPGAIIWFSLLLVSSLVPPLIMAAGTLAGDNPLILWPVRIALLVIAFGAIFWLVWVTVQWRDGRQVYLLLASACIALMLATKETAFITLGTMAAACVCIVGRDAIRSAAREKRFPLMPLMGAEGGAVLAALVLKTKMPEVAADFAKRAAENIGALSNDGYSTLFYILIFAIPAGLVVGLFEADKRSTLAASREPLLTWRKFKESLGGKNQRIFLVAGAAIVAVYLIVLYFSSFFTHWSGVVDFFRAYTIWLKTGSKDHTQNGFWAYVDWGIVSDGPIMILAAIGAVIALVKADRRFPRFAALWAFGLFTAYTIIPYKTPWLAVSFLLPMCIIAGYGAASLFTSLNAAIRSVGFVIALAAIGGLTYQTFVLNYVRYDDEDAPMVYAHTQREFLDMVADIEHFAEVSGKGKDASIDVLSPDYWPLVWYMRDYPKAIFHGKFITKSDAEVLVIKKGEQDNEAIRYYSGRYSYYSSYKLRSGVELALWVRNDLLRGEGEQLFKIGGDR